MKESKNNVEIKDLVEWYLNNTIGEGRREREKDKKREIEEKW